MIIYAAILVLSLIPFFMYILVENNVGPRRGVSQQTAYSLQQKGHILTPSSVFCWNLRAEYGYSS